MSQMRFAGLTAAVGAILLIGGCPADDSGNETNATMPTTATASTTVAATDTDPPATSSTTEDASESGGSSSSGTVTTDLTSADMQVIWDGSCTTDCHMVGAVGPTAWTLLPLTSDVAYENLINKDALITMGLDDIKLIVPGEPDNSYLLYKLRGTHTDLVGAAGGLQMPMDRVDPTMSAPLPDATIDDIEEWIAGGAPE